MPAFLKQPINQWLCIALMSVMCIWTVMYYTIDKAVGAIDVVDEKQPKISYEDYLE